MKNSISSKIAWGLVCMFCFSQVALAQDKKTTKNIKASVSRLEKAIKGHNFGLVEKDFDEEFSYANLGCGTHCSSSIEIVSHVISTYPLKIERIEVGDIKNQGPDFKVMTTFHFKKEDPAQQEILMGGDGKFLELALPGIQLKFGAPQQASKGGKSSCGKRVDKN